MASVTRSHLPALAPPKARPLAPHPGLEIEPGPLAAAPTRVARGRRLALALLGDLAFWQVALVAIGLLAFGATSVVYALSLTGNLSTEGDNAIYIILAKSLATGHGYMNIQDPVPRIEAQFPPLFPLLLAPIVWLWGTDAVQTMQALVTAFALGAFALSFLLFRRWTGSAMLAAAIVAGYASSDLVWAFSHKVLTELPYLFFTLLACWWGSRYAAEGRWRSWVGLLAALACRCGVPYPDHRHQHLPRAAALAVAGAASR